MRTDATGQIAETGAYGDDCNTSAALCAGAGGVTVDGSRAGGEPNAGGTARYGVASGCPTATCLKPNGGGSNNPFGSSCIFCSPFLGLDLFITAFLGLVLIGHLLETEQTPIPPNRYGRHQRQPSPPATGGCSFLGIKCWAWVLLIASAVIVAIAIAANTHPAPLEEHCADPSCFDGQVPNPSPQPKRTVSPPTPKPSPVPTPTCRPVYAQRTPSC